MRPTAEWLGDYGRKIDDVRVALDWAFSPSGDASLGVAPGPIETELFRKNTPAGSERERRFLSLVPMRRLGTPEEIAAMIAFLLSEDASYITGQTLFVDGGGSIGKAAA